jgi:hypothetical protein
MPDALPDSATFEAAERLGQLFDGLRAAGFGNSPTQDRALQELLVRVAFCCFAEDTGIFEKDQFRQLLETHTRPNGSDTATRLHQLFQTLSQPVARRPSSLLPALAALPCLSPGLFGEVLPLPAFTAGLRARLLACTHVGWAHLSPPLFAALFQVLPDPYQRQRLGEHSMPEAHVLRAIGPLFLDELRRELAQAGHDAARLDALHARLAALRLFDPACGNGTFLVVAYRELRLLELDLLRVRYGAHLPASALLPRVRLSQCAGLETDGFLARVAELALWLVDHQLNQRLAATFGQPTPRPPLADTLHLVRAISQEANWEEGLPPVDYLFGDFRRGRQGAHRDWRLGRPDLGYVYWSGIGGLLRLARYLAYAPDARAAFMLFKDDMQGSFNTNQWQDLLHEHGAIIQFAHRPFAGNIRPGGPADKRSVVVGLGRQTGLQKQLFGYDTPTSEPRLTLVPHINHYLLAAPEVWFGHRLQPLANVPALAFGSYPSEVNYVLLSEGERRALLAQEPAAAPYLSRVLQFIFFRENQPLWGANLQEVPATAWAHLPALRALRDDEHQKRLARRQQLPPAAAMQLTEPEPAAIPASNYVALPLGVQAEAPYLSAAYVAARVVPGSMVEYIPQATHYLFGMVISAMFSAWVRQLSSVWKYGYRNEGLVTYHNFPFPAAPTPAQVADVEAAVAAVRAVRGPHPSPSPVYKYWGEHLLPERLAAAAQLDAAVDRCFRSEPFATEQERLEFLFEAYLQQAAAQDAG